MQKKDKKRSKLLISTISFFITGLISLAFWNIFLLREIKSSGRERKELRKDVEKIEVMEEVNKSFIKDVLTQKAIELCFLQLIGGYGEKYTIKEKQDCIQLIVVADERYGHKGLDAALILAWLELESDGNPEAVSYAGAKGLTQLMDFRAEKVLAEMGYPGFSSKLVFDPVVNLAGGLSHFVGLMDFWEWKGIKNQYLVIFYALHSYKWGSGNTVKLFNSGRKEYRPGTKYVNWILNRREYWHKKLEYWMDNSHKIAKEKAK